MKNAWKYVWTLLLAAGLWSCEEGDDLLDEEGYEVPATYTFTRDGASTVDYSGQTARLDMLIEIGTYIKGQISAQQAIDSTKVINMLSNSGNPFTAEALNNSGKQLLDKCADKDLMLSYVYELAAITADDTLALNPNRLYDKKGIEYWQLLEKGLMGSVFYSQVVSNYTLPSKIGDDQNIALADGKNYRPAEHHWDEAFGYFGVPVDFPTNTTGIRFYGKYCNDRDPLVGTNAIMNAFIKGRAAITHQDSPTRDAMAKEVRRQFERAIAATAMKYLNGGKKGIAEDNKDLQYHELSEGVAFINALRYNESGDAAITDAQVDQALLYVWGADQDLTKSTAAELNKAIDLLAGIYGWESIKGDF